MRRLAALAAALLLVALAAPAAATTPDATLADLEDEVMCPICGTLLGLAESPQAKRQRALINRQIALGKDKEEIKQVLIAQYGREVLAEPEGSGFDLTAYLVPAIAFLVAAVALGIGVRRWRRAGDGPGNEGEEPRGPADEDARRLEDDLARYDL